MLMINDWFHETSDEIALRLAATEDSMRPLCASSVLFNGMGRVSCPPPMPGRNSFGCEAMMMMGSGMSDSMSRSQDASFILAELDKSPCPWR